MARLTKTRIGYLDLSRLNRLEKMCGVEPDDDNYYHAPVSKEVTLVWPKHGINASEIVAMCPPGLKPRPAIFKPEDGENQDIVRSIGGFQSVREEAAFLIDRALGYYLVPVSYVAEVENSSELVSKSIDFYKDNHTGVMIAFELSHDTVKKISVSPDRLPDGSQVTPPDEFHITLIYLGEAKDFQVGRDEVSDIVRTFALKHNSISGSIRGVARFGGEEEKGTQALVMLFDSPELPRFRQELVESLGELVSKQNHGFTAHTTLAYIPKESTVPIAELAQRDIAVTFDKIFLAWGNEHFYYPLGKDKQPSHITVVEKANSKPDVKSNKSRGAVIHYVPVTKRKPVASFSLEWIEKSAIFDYIMGQIDRRGHNWMVNPHDSQKPVLYDNGYSLPSDGNHHIHSAFIETWADNSLTDTNNLTRVLRDSVLWRDVVQLVGNGAAELAQDRLNFLIEKGAIANE